MKTYRVYFLDGRSIIAAEMIDALSHGEAAHSAVRGLPAYPWARGWPPTAIEVWRGTTLHQATALV